ncbi:hypothetical protein ACSBRS_010065 [Streptococcus suis]|uniref:hypothetical protein n=1 Tax=Streptococcus suis TaxID=1307 RepID=UPI002AAE7668|nr:hypothetical protein [Streptococcus suis]HEM6183451.1 hypothetical protein [Streptococcus suis]
MANIIEKINHDIDELKLRTFINDLEDIGDVIFFGGYVRDKYLGLNKAPRDIDIVIDSGERVDLRKYLIEKMQISSSSISTNEYGGLKLECDNIKIDLWSIYDTHAFKNSYRCLRNWRSLTETTYSNFDSIALNYSNQCMETSRFDSFVKNCKIESVLENNSDLILNLLKLLIHQKQYQQYFESKITFSKEIIQDYIKNKHRVSDLYERQINRYGSYIMAMEEIEEFIENLECSM